jgi:hypothetical protein
LGPRGPYGGRGRERKGGPSSQAPSLDYYLIDAPAESGHPASWVGLSDLRMTHRALLGESLKRPTFSRWLTKYRAIGYSLSVVHSCAVHSLRTSAGQFIHWLGYSSCRGFSLASTF